MPNKQIVKASEIGEYLYCERSWWLRFNEILSGQTTAMEIGIQKHNQLSDHLNIHQWLKLAAMILIVISFGLLVLIWLLS